MTNLRSADDLMPIDPRVDERLRRLEGLVLDPRHDETIIMIRVRPEGIAVTTQNLHTGRQRGVDEERGMYLIDPGPPAAFALAIGRTKDELLRAVESLR